MSILKINLLEFNEYHIHTTRSSRFKHVTPKIKGIESETFYYHVNQDGYLLPDTILGWLLSTFNKRACKFQSVFKILCFIFR